MAQAVEVAVIVGVGVALGGVPVTVTVVGVRVAVAFVGVGVGVPVGGRVGVRETLGVEVGVKKQVFWGVIVTVKSEQPLLGVTSVTTTTT